MNFSIEKIFLFGFLLILFSCKGKNEIKTVESSTGDAALDQLNQLIKNDPNDISLLFERAQLLYERESYDGAIMDLENAISKDSLLPELYHLLSDVNMDYYKSKDALIAMQKCVKLFPERIPSLLKMSETEYILKQYDNSLATCSRILSLNPQNAEAYFMMGMNLRDMPDNERAKVAFRKATELDPELVDAWLILGQIYEFENDPKALDYYTAATNIDSGNPQTWHSKAFYLQNNGKENEAIEIYRKINLIDKDYIDAYLNAGILYLAMDSIDQAYDQFNILVNVKPQFYMGHYYRGISNERKGQLTNALDDYKTSLKLNPSYKKAEQAINALEEQS